MSANEIVERRKPIAEPILNHLMESCPEVEEQVMILLMCMTEIIARSVQSRDTAVITDRMKEMTDAWMASLHEDEPPSPDPQKPALLQ